MRSALNPGPLKPQGRRPPRVSSSPFELTPAPLDSYGLHRQHRHDAHMLHTHCCTLPRLNCPWITRSRAICSSRFVCVRRRFMDEESRSRSQQQQRQQQQQPAASTAAGGAAAEGAGAAAAAAARQPQPRVGRSRSREPGLGVGHVYICRPCTTDLKISSARLASVI